ncbi:Protein CBG27276 [Caenorhabditis briggsae]|uniref:Protein CBG27276 n=1 Tax=Caenorhabditis briggsae TaxID=6238 RepID=B6IM48_CAEBR|nr:Protein CBG27276 [Caenorhabditis briggsae]CAS00978.1 Protein CBG27276 [Caenorhabditis briggsae]
MPDLAMNLILSKSDFRSILVLRKVCKDLRNFIEDTEPDLQIRSMEISTVPSKQNNPKISVYFIGQFGQHHHISYRKHKSGCQEIYGNRKSLMKNSDHFQVFREDMNWIFKHQKSILKFFGLNLTSQGSEILEILKNNPMKMEYLRVTADKTQIFEILRSVSPGVLKIAELYFVKPGEVSIQEWKGLKCWESVEEFYAENLVISGSVTDLGHFSKAVITVFQVTQDELFLMKEIFLITPKFQKFIVHYKHFVEEGISELRRDIHEVRKLLEIFGPPNVDGGRYGKKWYYRIPNSEDVLRFSFCLKSSEFTRLPSFSVPKGAI